MKVLFWIVAVLSIPVGLVGSLFSRFAHGIGVSGTAMGDVLLILGMFSVLVSIGGIVLGIIKLRKGNVKKAVAFALLGIIYPVVLGGAGLIENAVYGMLLERDIDNRNEQIYGENWDAPPAIEGIPELYQEVLNQLYVAVGESWPAENLMDFGIMPMADYYGDASLDNIGFLLMDVNGDNVDELLIGTTAPAEEGTAIFCFYSDPENPFLTLQAQEGEIYYLHSTGTDGIYMAEIYGRDAAWLLEATEGESIINIIYQEGTVDPTNRLTLDMIPFSQYK